MLRTLKDQELELIRRCIIAAKDRIGGGYYSRIGIRKSEADAILQRWPLIAKFYSQESCGIELLSYNSLNEVLHGVRISEEEIIEEIGASSGELSEILERWRRNCISPNRPQ